MGCVLWFAHHFVSLTYSHPPQANVTIGSLELRNKHLSERQEQMARSFSNGHSLLVFSYGHIFASLQLWTYLC